MLYANVFNLFIIAMEIAVLFFTLVAVVFMVAITLIQRQNVTQSRRQDELNAVWGKAFRSAFTHPPESLPKLDDRDRYAVLLIFNAIRELRQSDRDNLANYGARLDSMAHALKLDLFARDLFVSGDDTDRLLAISVLGQMGDTTLLPSVMQWLGSPALELSQASAQYMLRVNPETIDDVLAQVSFREDWMPPRVEQMLREVGAKRLDPAMKRTLPLGGDRGKQQLLEFIGCCSGPTAREICLGMLESSKNPELTAAALRALAPNAEPEDVAVARRYLNSESWFVQLAALRVLEPLADTNDLPTLERLAGDRDWWVRRRAAELLVAVSGDKGPANALAGAHPDAYARDAITQAMAEHDLGIKDGELADTRSKTNRGPGARA